METFSLHSLWQKAKRGDWIVGLRWEMPGEEQLWEAWIRAAARAGHRLLYFRQDGALSGILQDLPGTTLVDAPQWSPNLRARLLDLLPREGPLTVGLWEDLQGLLSQPDPRAAWEILEALDWLRREAPVIWFTLIRGDPDTLPLFTPPVPLSSFIVIPLTLPPDPLLLTLALQEEDPRLPPGLYRLVFDPEPRLEFLAHTSLKGLLPLFGILHRQRQQQQTLEQRMRLLAALAEGTRWLPDLPAFLNVLIRELVEHLEVDRGAIALREGPDRLRIVAEHRRIEGPSALGAVINLTDDPLSARVVQTRQPLVLNKIQDPALFGASTPLLQQLGIRSILIVPIPRGEEVLGNIGLDSVRVERPFGPQEVQLVQTIAEGVAGLIEGAQALERQQRLAQLLEALHRILRSAVEVQNFEDFLHQVLAQAMEALESPIGVLWAAGRLSARGISSPVLESIEDTARKEGLRITETLAVSDYRELPPSALRDALLQAGIRASLSVPIRAGERPIGVLGLASPTPRRWRPEEIALAEAIALEIGHTVERIRFVRHLRLLYRLADALSGFRDLHGALQPIFDLIRSELMAREVGLYLPVEEDPSTLACRIRSASGSRSVFPARMRRHAIPALEPIFQGQALWFTDPPGAPTPFPTRSLALLPLKHEGEILGSLAIAWEKPAVFDADTREFLFRVAALLTTGALNERLWRQLERRARELESLTESLQQALKLREQMIQNVSHELRTPLAILQGYIELMREEALGPLTSEQREALEVMQERLNGLIRYVELLLTLQEIQAGARSLNILDLRELVREACRAYQSRLDPQRHALRVHLPDHPVWVMGEGERLLLTLTELLENAVKFSPAGGTIQVSLAVQGPEALLEVRDEGIGIPAEAISRVFEPFYQVNGGTTRKFGGMGIGLTVVKQVVEAHQGRVEIESAVGQGTRVLLRLPIVIP